MKEVLDFKSLFDILSEYRLKDSYFVLLEEGIFRENFFTKIDLAQISNLSSDYYLPEFYLKKYPDKDVLFLLGKKDFFKESYYFYYALLEVVKELGIKKMIVEDEGYYLSDNSYATPQFILGSDFFSLGIDITKFFRFFPDNLPLPEFFNLNKSLSEELLEIAEQVLIKEGFSFQKEVIFYKANQLLPTPFELKFLFNSSLRFLTFSPLWPNLYADILDFEVLSFFWVADNLTVTATYHKQFFPLKLETGGNAVSQKQKNSLILSFIDNLLVELGEED